MEWLTSIRTAIDYIEEHRADYRDDDEWIDSIAILEADR